MVASSGARQRRLQTQCGELGRASVRVSKHNNMIYKITCRECIGRDATTYRSGHPNSYMDAISRWNRHLIHVHPDQPAPPSIQIEADAVVRGYTYESVRQRNEYSLR